MKPEVYKSDVTSCSRTCQIWHVRQQCCPIWPPCWPTNSGEKNVRGMFVLAQNILANICCSIECCLIWPLCSRTIQLSQVKVAGELCENHLSRLLLARVELQNGF